MYFSNASIQESFDTYYRGEAIGHTKYMVIFMVFLSLAHIVAFVFNKLEHGRDFSSFVVFYGVPTVTLSLLYFVSKRNLKILDWAGGIFYISFTVSYLLVLIIKLANYEDRYIMENMDTAFAYPLFMYGGFLNMRFLSNFLVRFICLSILCMSYTNAHGEISEKEGYEKDVFIPVIFYISLIISSESFFYANLRAKAKLFL